MQTDNSGASEGRKPARGRKWLLLVVGVVLAGGAFGGWYYWRHQVRETAGDVQDRYRQRFTELRAKLKRVAANLPPVGSVKDDTLPTNLDPKPVYNTDTKVSNNALLMAAHCEDPDRGVKKPDELDLGDFRFLAHLRDTGDRGSSNREGSSENLAQEYEQSLALKYLVVVRPVKFTPIKVDVGLSGDKASFTGGEVDLEVFLVDLETEKPLGAFRRSFGPGKDVIITVRNGRVDTSSATNTIYDSVSTSAAVGVKLALDRATGGNFK